MTFRYRCLLLSASFAMIGTLIAPIAFAQETSAKVIPAGAERDAAVFSTVGTTEVTMDQRLKRATVDFVEADIYVTDLLTQISKQTGVTLTASKRYHTAGWKVCVSLQKRSLADTMNALRSAMSFKNAYWTWRRAKTNKGYSYELVGTDALTVFEESTQKAIRTDFEKQWEASIDSLNVPQETLEIAKEGSFHWYMKDRNVQLGVKLLSTNLSSQEMQVLLKSESKRITLPYEKLNQEGRNFVDTQVKNSDALHIQHGYSPTAKPRSNVTLLLSGSPSKLTPSLSLLLDNIGGGAYVGGTPFENKWRATILAEYITRDDTATPPLPSAKLVEPSDESKRVPDKDTPSKNQTRSPFRQQTLPPFVRRVKQFAVAELEDKTSFAFIACLSQGDQNMPGIESPYGKTLDAYVKRLAEMGVASKQNSGILCLRYLPGLTNGDNQVIPDYELVRRANAIYDAAPDGVPPLSDLIYLSSNWSAKEMLRVPKESAPYLNDLGRGWGTAYKALGKEPSETLAALQSPEGLPAKRISVNLAKEFGIDYATTRSTTLRARLIRELPRERGLFVQDYFEIYDPQTSKVVSRPGQFGVVVP